MVLDEQLGYVMLGYEKSIAALSHLDYKSETIQILVSLIYQLQCDDADVDLEDSAIRKNFAKEQCNMMLRKSDDYIEIIGEEGFEFILHAITYFGNN